MKRTKLTQQVLLALLIGSTFWSGTASAETRTITGNQTEDVTLPGSGNTLIIESGTTGTSNEKKFVAGYLNGDSGTVTGNTMTINGAEVYFECYGGYAAGSYNTVSGNTITVNGSKRTGGINGGYAEGSNNTVSGNTVIINAGRTGDIYGGRVNGYHGSNNTVSGNTVIINGGGTSFVYGGESGCTGSNNTVSGNTVIINSTMYRSVYGGETSGSGNLVTGNTVILNASVLDSEVYGGHEYMNSDVVGNTVLLNRGSMNHVYGGFGETKGGGNGKNKVNENTVIMNGGEASTVYGGYVNFTAASANGNTVIMNGGLIKETLSGGYMRLGGDANNNTVILNGGSFGTGNTSTNIYGGCAGAYGPGAGIYSGDANGNTVILNGGSVAKYTHLCGGKTCFHSTKGDANNNTVTLKSGTFAGETITAGESYMGTANGNVVNVYAGAAISQDVWLIAAGVAHAGDACNNTMNLYGSIYLPDCELFGGQKETSHASSGNTLNVYGQATVAMINYFQNYSFYIPATLTGSTALLALTSTNFSYFSTDATVSSVSLAGDSAYTSGDTITLLSGDLSPTKSSLSTHSLTVQKGIAAFYPATLNLNLTQYGPGSSLTMTLGEGTLNPKVKSLSEAQSAVLANLNTGADLAADRGMENALAAAAGGNGQAVGFVGTSAGQETISTGSEVDGRSFGVMIGAAGQHRIPAGQLTTGVFAEIGRGSFNTRNEVSGATVNAEGHSDYKGGGILARLDRTNGSWYEGSLHTGHMDSTYSSADVTDYLGNGTSYDVGSPYCSAHIGLGHVWRLGQKEQLDLYGKYFWSHVPSRSVTVSSGDVFDFAGATSNRLRLGMRWTKHCDDSSVYAGLAVERELSGSQRATVAGFDVPAPSLRGTTGIAELGWRVPQTAGNPFGLDLSLAGLFGKRQGVTGGVSFIWGW